jgi:hypothetical protein
MVVTAISAFVFAGVLSAYIFLGRGLVREGHEEELESRSRAALYYLTQDVSAATGVSTYTPSTLVLTTPAATVTYTFTPAAPVQGLPQGSLTRTQIPANTSIPTSLLTGLSSFAFNYLTISGGQTPPITPPASAAAVKQVQMTYTAMAGSSISGAQSQITVVSPRVIMKNKPSLP